MYAQHQPYEITQARSILQLWGRAFPPDDVLQQYMNWIYSHVNQEGQAKIEEIEWLKEIYDQLFEERAGEEKGLYYDLAAPRGHAGREVLPQLLGPDITIPELIPGSHKGDLRWHRHIDDDPLIHGLMTDDVAPGRKKSGKPWIKPG